VENWFGEVVESLPPGAHTLRLEFTARKADGSDGPVMAAGECNLTFTAAQKAAWAAKCGAQHLFVPPGLAGPHHITIVNDCGNNVSYRIQRADKGYNETMGANQNVSVGLSAGDQILLNGRPIHVISAASEGQTVTLCR
jgi:hypothetical protein